MLVTVYQKTKKMGWIVANKYYWFPVELDPTDALSGSRQIKPRHTCPGCNKKFTALSIRDHHCLGGKNNWPKLPSRTRPITQTEANELDPAIREYIERSQHPIIYTE